jgi:hypothetical protein
MRLREQDENLDRKFRIKCLSLILGDAGVQLDERIEHHQKCRVLVGQAWAIRGTIFRS